MQGDKGDCCVGEWNSLGRISCAGWLGLAGGRGHGTTAQRDSELACWGSRRSSSVGVWEREGGRVREVEGHCRTGLSSI